ncbi:hypothetical protein K438DRAFT_2027929 [Mycena galopus ATCC 62051]|nr:hypothetical protein K438DRAFT_2027929 [Mycena galopus ATCC 62051]
MVHVSITTPRSATFTATFIFSWSALTNLCSWREIGSGECDHSDSVSIRLDIHVLDIQPFAVSERRASWMMEYHTAPTLRFPAKYATLELIYPM